MTEQEARERLAEFATVECVSHGEGSAALVTEEGVVLAWLSDDIDTQDGEAIAVAIRALLR